MRSRIHFVASTRLKGYKILDCAMAIFLLDSHHVDFEWVSGGESTKQASEAAAAAALAAKQQRRASRPPPSSMPKSLIV